MRVPGTTTTTKDIGLCFACDKSIVATVDVKVSDLHIDGPAGTANVKVVGFSVSHDCRTKATAEPTTPACDRDHADDWVEVDMETWLAQPDGTRMRQDWVNGVHDGGSGHFVHRDDLPNTTPKEETR